MLRPFVISRSRIRLLATGALLALVAFASLGVTRFALPPTVGVDAPFYSALLVVLGGSRGILAEILWWRIGDLQKQNRYAELVPLTDLLVALEPSSADARAYNAWNLAYNISAAHQDPAERWQWVCKGLDLLERGLAIQPASGVLLRQAGWFWEDKIGGDNDSAAPYYRSRLAERPVPTTAADGFAAQIGTEPDWNNPRVRALFYYTRAGDAYDTLRVLTAILTRADSPAFIPFYTETARAVLPELAAQQFAQIRAFTQTLDRAFPNRSDLQALLQELTHDSSDR